jgi:prefoldin beta subunit
MDPNFARKLQDSYEGEMKALQAINQKIAQLGEPRQKLVGQISENKMVQKEMEILEDEAVLYKLVGPVLVKQDLVDAKDNVRKRVEYYEKEMERVQKIQAEHEKEQQGHRAALQKIQSIFETSIKQKTAALKQ